MNTIDMEKATKRSYSYITESARATDGRFNFLKLPQIATKNKRSPSVINYSSKTMTASEREDIQRLKEPTRTYRVKLDFVTPKSNVNFPKFHTPQHSDLMKAKAPKITMFPQEETLQKTISKLETSILQGVQDDHMVDHDAKYEVNEDTMFEL